VFGVLILYAAEPDSVSTDEVDLLRRLADNLAYALRVLRMKAAGEQAVRKHDALEAQLHQAQKMEAIGRLAGGVAHDFNNMLAVIAGHTDLALEQTAPDSALYADLLEIQNAAQRSADLTVNCWLLRANRRSRRRSLISTTPSPECSRCSNG